MATKNDKIRDDRISDKILIDSYGDEEQLMSWYCYLDENLSFPFEAKGITKRGISPLKTGEVVKVLKMAPEEDCEGEMFVIISWRGSNLGVPLSQLQPIKTNVKTKQATEDWRYWSQY